MLSLRIFQDDGQKNEVEYIRGEVLCFVVGIGRFVASIPLDDVERNSVLRAPRLYAEESNSSVVGVAMA